MQKYFSKATYLTTLRRYWTGGALMTLILSISALAYHQSISDSSEFISGAYKLQHRYQGAAQIFNPSIVFILGAAVVCALLVFSFTHHKRAVVMMHALPVRREAHFISAFLGGLTLLWVPVLFYAGLITFIQLAASKFVGGYIIIWLGLALLSSLICYSFIIFAGQLTGTAFAQIAVGGLLISLPVFIEYFIGLQSETYLFGANLSGVLPVNEKAHPFAIMAGLWSRAEDFLSYQNPGKLLMNGWDALKIVIVLLSSAAFIAGALQLYRRRKLESAGEFIAYRGMRPVFRYGGAFLSALLFSAISMGIFNNEPLLMAVFAAFGGILGFFIAEMLIRKSIKVWKNWKGALLFTGCYAALTLALVFDVFGYGSYVLPKDKVESIYLKTTPLSWHNTEIDLAPFPYLFTESDDIAAALALQERIAKNGKRPEGRSSRMVSVTYHMEAKLNNGKTVSRVYRLEIPFTERDGLILNWGDVTGPYEAAADAQKLELLRDVSRKARSVMRMYYYYTSAPEDRRGELMTSKELHGLLDALLLDNELAGKPRWDAAQHLYYSYGYGFSYDRYYYSPDQDTQNFLASLTVIISNGTSYNDVITVVIHRDDANAVRWLLDNGYLTKELLDAHDAHPETPRPKVNFMSAVS